MLLDILTIVDGLLQLLVAVIPVAIWQRTRVDGFLWLAASFVMGALLQWLSPLLFRIVPAENSELVMYAFRAFSLLMLMVAAVGFFRIYTVMKAPRAPAGG